MSTRALFALAIFGPSVALSDICRTATLNEFIPALAPENCGLSQSLDGTMEDHCAWRYPLGSLDAKVVFDDLKAALTKCATLLPSDQRVNHPDSYDLHIYDTGTELISISLKEKYALSARYIFLRRTR